MNTNYKQRTMTSTENHRSYFDWGCNMQVIRKGNGEIAMTESELTRFFGVTWRKRSCNFNCVKALIFHILPHLDDTIFNRASQMRNLSARGKVT